MDALANLSAATTALAEARTLDDVKRILDIAEAARTYARAAKLGLDAANYATEIKLRAERKAGDLLAQLERGNGPGRGHTAEKMSQDVTPFSEYSAVLNENDINRMTANRWQTVATIPDEVFEAHIAETKADGDELSTAGLLRVAQELKRAATYQQKKESPPLVGKYKVIYADPPWRYANSGFDQSAAEHYPTMSTEEICALPVSDLADEPCALYLWATAPLLPDAIEVMNAWGFEYKSHRVWVKNKAPGMGWWLRTNHELLLIGTRNGNAHPSEKLDSVVEAPVAKHSRKPEIFRMDIEKCHEGPRLEMFAREDFDGWEVWGNECN